DPRDVLLPLEERREAVRPESLFDEGKGLGWGRQEIAAPPERQAPRFLFLHEKDVLYLPTQRLLREGQRVRNRIARASHDGPKAHESRLPQRLRRGRRRGRLERSRRECRCDGTALRSIVRSDTALAPDDTDRLRQPWAARVGLREARDEGLTL